MKKLLYLALVLILPTSILVADSGDRRIEGYWFSTHANYEIQIKSKSYGLKVKGLPGCRHDWRRFATTRRHNVFIDHNGNVLIRDSRARLTYKMASRNGSYGHRDGREYTFSRDEYGSYDRYSSGDCRVEYDPWSNGQYRDYRSNDRGYRDNYRDDHRGGQSSASSIRNTVSGDWKTIGLNKNKRVEIRKVQTGINARLKNKDNWVFYAQDRQEPNLFTDRHGNRYILKRDLSLKWIGINGKDFVLEKY